MKFTNSLRTSLYTTVGALLLTLSSFAQAPEKMSYQAVIRGANNALVTNQQVGMQISILQGSTAVYEETQTPTSNTNGLVSLEIGTGTVISGSFAAIDWSADTYFIKTETDPTGGTNYTITGTSQLLSVPFALYATTSGDAGAVAANTAKVGYTEAAVSANTDVAANTAKVGYTEELVSANTDVVANTTKVGITAVQASAITDNTTKYSKNEVDALIANLQSQINNLVVGFGVGDFYGGGVVFYIFESGDTGYVAGETHGLVCALGDTPQDTSEGLGLGFYGAWVFNGNSTDLLHVPNVLWNGGNPVGPGARIGDGKPNTDAIIVAQGNDGNVTFAAGQARAYNGGEYTDWFLPSAKELNQIYINKTTLEGVNGFNGFNGNGFSNLYWSSSEYDSNNAWGQNFANGSQNDNSKTNGYNVRAVRAF